MKLVLCREPEMFGGVWYTTTSCAEFPLHIEDELELNLVVNGSATVFAGGSRYRAARGDLVWLRPGKLHGLVERSKDMVMWVVSARSRAVELARRVDPTLGSGHAAELVSLSGEALDRLSARCCGLLQAQRQTERFNRLLVEFLVDASIVRVGTKPRPREIHPAVARASSLLSTPREPRWRLSEVAKRAGLSPSELSRLFHRQLGVTLVHYANHQRVQLFGKLYSERPELTTMQNALDAGFGSYSQFFRIFRAVTNLTPDQFRDLCEDGTLPSPRPRGSRQRG